ncbi:hypothetical protein [Bradyrhizobium prioriisuperbiae]|uniref:hypothetical protein n=1 Tax=Bradyrhizobium prioriisuperbiae TaxID=2854389 RepID=UPI0028E9AA9F|nr:hypothetical protein [Bradyrhizobium prioritasuperba]
MTTTTQTSSHLLETAAIGLACLLSLSILIRFHDADDAAIHHASPPAFGPAYAQRKTATPPAVDPNDEVRKLIAEMRLHD